jgi:hypothetical protein
MQDSNEDSIINQKDETISQYKTGRTINIGLSLNF